MTRPQEMVIDIVPSEFIVQGMGFHLNNEDIYWNLSIDPSSYYRHNASLESSYLVTRPSFLFSFAEIDALITYFAYAEWF